MPKKTPSLYRKVALEHISTPEQLNQTIQIISRKSWVLLLTLCALITFVVLWAFLGTITTRVRGEGMILTGGSGLYNAVGPKGEGKIVNILVKPGDPVKKGQVVVNLESTDLNNQIASAQQSLEILQSKYKELVSQSEAAIKIRRMEVAQLNQALERVVSEQRENLKQIEELLKARQESFKKGLVTKQDVVQSWQDYYRSRKEIQSGQEQILQNQINTTSFIDAWNERLRELDLKIKDKTQELNQLKAQLQSSKTIQSPIDGHVISVRAQLGDIVKVGEAILSIAPLNSSLDVVAYVPAETGKKVKQGSAALVSPSIVKKEEYGSIVGRVTHVAEYPSSPESMNAILQNNALVQRLIEQKLPIEVRIYLIPDPKTVSGLKWTSRQGPSQKITPGTIVEAYITVRRQAPVTLIIPTIKKLFGE